MLLSNKSIEFIRAEKCRKTQSSDNQQFAILPNFAVFSSEGAVGGKIGQNEAGFL